MCPKPQAERMPDRVISIDRGEHGIKLKLLETKGLAEPYCTLSYVWRSDQEMKTTHATLDQYKNEIPFEELPATVQHAVTTTDKLGLSYLFIDAFCIIQKDSTDIQNQLSQMPDIYTNATVTILAGRAINVNDGFLQDRGSSLQDFSEDNWRY